MTRPLRKRATLSAVVTLAALVVPVAPATAAAEVAPETAAADPKPVRPGITTVHLADAAKARPAVLGARDSARFSMVGVTWERRAGDGVLAQVRVRSGGRWSAWQTLPTSHDHAPDQPEAGGRDGTEPVWVGPSDGVQARVTSADGAPVRGVRLALVDPGTTPADAPVALDRAAAAPAPVATAAVKPAPYARPAMVNRAGWGADESLRTADPTCVVPAMGSTIKTAFVHHTAGTNSYTSSQSAGLVRGIYAFHVQERGYCDLGYNFLVDRFGRIFEGRYGGIQLPVVGAHTGGFNTDTFGVSLMGEFTATEPTAAMMESAAQVIAWKLDGHYRNPNGTVAVNGTTFNVIAGHRDGVATECPGNLVYAKLPALRSRVWTLMGKAVGTEIYDLAVALGGYAVVGQPYYLEHPVPEGRGTWFGTRDIYWSTATGAHSVYGPIRTLHRGLGNANGVLGLPRYEETAARVSGARFQEFRKAGARRGVWWSQATGAREVLDAIFTKYVAMNGETSSLGLPTTGQLGTHVVGGRVNVFQHGRLYWGSATGAHPVIGAFNNAYVQSGVYTRLGLPRTDAFSVTGGLAQDFTGGRITWNATTAQTTVTYN